MKKPYLVFFYSLLLPGLGQFYLGEHAKGWTLLSMAVGVAVSLVISHTMTVWFVMGGIYLAIMIPAAVDAFQAASGRPRTFSGDSVPYVLIMLCLVGPFAIPLLWQSRKFPAPAKVICTVLVILIAFASIAVLSVTASFFDQFLRQNASF